MWCCLIGATSSRNHHGKSHLSYGAYGAGDKPAIYGARENAAGAEWKKVSDNIWMINSYVFNDIGNIVFNHGEAVGRKKLQNTLTANYHFYHNKETGQLYLYRIKETRPRFLRTLSCVRRRISS